jgi:hypothetical protein
MGGQCNACALKNLDFQMFTEKGLTASDTGGIVTRMSRTNTKETAEALLRELPSVVGAFVREDLNGHPREVHLLVGPGPNPRHLARDVRDLLEERLGLPVDQRIISIAQLAVSAEQLALDQAAPATPALVTPLPVAPAGDPRLRFQSLETQTREGTVVVRVRLEHGARVITGEGVEVDVGVARLRAAASAALHAAAIACDQRMRFQLDGATPVRALGRNYVLVTVLASSPMIGRKPALLAGAQPMDEEPDQAAALAALMAVNRVVAKAISKQPTT